MTFDPYEDERLHDEAVAANGGRAVVSLTPDLSGRRMSWVLAADVKMSRPRQVWRDRVPAGGVTLLAGMEGQGKTVFATYLAARITHGQLEGDYFGEPGDVIYIGSEDDRAAIVKPRLVAAGADCSRIRFIDIADGGTFSTSCDLAELDLMLTERPGVKAIFIDPVDSHLGDRIDSHRKSEVQSALGKVAALAQRHDLGVVGVAHLNKGDSSELLRRVVGSVGFTTSARSVLGVGTHPDDESERLVVLAKSNYANRQQVPAIRYRIEGVAVDSDDGPIDAATVVWLGEQDGIDADALVATMSHAERSERDAAADWLNDVLGAGPVKYADIERAAREANISRATLHRAKVLVGVDVSRDDNARGRPSTWRLSSQPLSSQSQCLRDETKSNDALTRPNALDFGVSSHGIGDGTKPHVARNSGNNEWYTPAEYVDAARRVMGPIDLDPASCEAANEVVRAASFYTVADDGLSKPWRGNVWMNPPYSKDLVAGFAEKLVAELDAGNVRQACALVNNATETRWFQTLISAASAVCLLSGRVRFWHPDRTSSAPLQGQAVIYFGTERERFRDAFADLGTISEMANRHERARLRAIEGLDA